MSKPTLALIPSGYKSGKVYSILPNDASGDFDFTRQSIGTRVRKDGLIEEAKTEGSITNLQIRSEEFDNSAWIKSDISVTANDTLAPNGTNTADAIVEGTGTGGKIIHDTYTTSAGVYTFSVHIKKEDKTYTAVQVSGSITTSMFNVDLDNGTGQVVAGSFDETNIETLANGWYRVSVTFTATSGTLNNQIYLMNGSAYADRNYTGNGTDKNYVWGAMLSEGALSDYIKTEGTTETKTVETFTDVPRLDWLNSNCPSLKLEPQRSNLFTYSEDTSQWTSVRGTTTPNNIIAPNGELVGSLYDKTEDANEGYVYRNLTVSSVGTYSVSVFFKYNNSQYAHFLLFDGISSGARAWFDIQNGVVGTTTSFGSTFTVSDLNIEDYGNGWYKCSAKYVVTGTDITWQFRVSPSGGNGVTNTDSGAKIYFFGTQIEEGSYPTSYIKTEASTVTRLKDECENGGDSDLFDITEGSLFVDFIAYVPSSTTNVCLSDGSNNNRVNLLFQTNGTEVICGIWASGVNSLYYTQAITFDTRNKLAITFKENEFKVYLNGSLSTTDTSGNMPSGMNKLGFASPFNTSHFEGKVYDTRVYDRVLTETEAIELTT